MPGEIRRGCGETVGHRRVAIRVSEERANNDRDSARLKSPINSLMGPADVAVSATLAALLECRIFQPNAAGAVDAEAIEAPAAQRARLSSCFFVNFVFS